MDKWIHIVIFFTLLILILLSCANIESFVGDLEESNMIPVIEFDKNSDIYESKCIDDYKWRKETKTCRDYSIFGYNCNDIGEDGRTADEACKVAV